MVRRCESNSPGTGTRSSHPKNVQTAHSAMIANSLTSTAGESNDCEGRGHVDMRACENMKMRGTCTGNRAYTCLKIAIMQWWRGGDDDDNDNDNDGRTRL